MTEYHQGDYQDQLGTCNSTIAKEGCFITALGILADIAPPEVNQILKDNNGYIYGCLVVSAAAAVLLNLEYAGISTTQPDYTTIAETHYFAPGTPQHFFVILPDGTIIDPLHKNIKYPIVSYRLFRAKETTMSIGFSDDHMRALLETFIAGARVQLLGGFDAKGAKADADFRMAQIKGGSITAFTEQFDAYMGAKDFKWMKKTDCKPTVCPKKDCTAEVEKETKVLMDEQTKFAATAKDEMSKRDAIIAGLTKDLDACKAVKPTTMSRLEHFLAIFS